MPAGDLMGLAMWSKNFFNDPSGIGFRLGRTFGVPANRNPAAPMTVVIKDLDLQTGIPSPFYVPDDTTWLGMGGFYGLKLSRSAIAYLYYKARKFRIVSPDGTDFCTVDQIFLSHHAAPGPNAFLIDSQSLFFPLQYQLNQDPSSSANFTYGLLNLDGFAGYESMGWSDGDNAYYPFFEFVGSAGRTGATDPSLSSVGTFTLKDHDGQQLGACPIYGDPMTPYGDVTVTVDTEWS